MNIKDELLYKEIIHLALGMEDKEKCVVALLYLALQLGCKAGEERVKNGDKSICEHCVLNYIGCTNILNCCKYHGLNNKEGDENND